ncbi:MAG: hypothetical protein JO235_02970 [Chroococcidiopsidaceae cyanobacterium CP_BM_RX_35]|nr:hypothetical protein [Chroococcidiopsidaceae cyanobacterium CP_BM_RX_35]
MWVIDWCVQGGGSISELLEGEGAVGRYGELLKLGRRGDNLTPHHVPSHAYMTAKVPSYTRNLGIAMMMEHLIPGAGGRHRQTLSYGQSPDLNLLPRQALAREIRDLRSIYQRQGIYTAKIRRSLQATIQMNQSAWTGIFDK